MSLKEKLSVPYMLLGTLFCVCIIAANLFETKLIQLGPIAVTGGLVIFPVSYIINDCIAEVYGFKKTRMLIWLGFAMNAFVVLLAQLVVLLPAANYWEHEEHFNFVFNFAPRITLASLLAFLLGSYVNAYIMSKMKVAQKGKTFALRAFLSTVAGESVDSLIFFPLAFGGVVPWDELPMLMGAQIVLKSLYEVVVLPLTACVVKRLKRVEQLDVYDEDIKYSLF